MADLTAGAGVNWSRAACLGKDPEMFFPDDYCQGKARARAIDEARRVCAHCPIMLDCREWANRTGQRYGVWGGVSQGERNRARKRPAGEHADGRDETAIDELMRGLRVSGTDRINRAHAVVRAYREMRGDVSYSELGRRFGVAPDAVRKWVKRDQAGEELINPTWLVKHREQLRRVASCQD